MLISGLLQETKIDPVEIEIFLAHTLGRDRSFIRAHPELKLDVERVANVKEFIARRAKHEPLAYILGYKEFCGLKFKADRRAAIPRPETEELVTLVISQVFSIPDRNRENHWKHDQLTIVDVGTGSGNIAVALAKAAPFAKIIAVEKDPAAASLAKENISLHNLNGKIELVSSDLLGSLNESVDIIVANLPYIPSSHLASLQPEITKWEPRVALDGGKDGLELYRKLFSQAPEVLKQNGLLFYELDGETHIKSFNESSLVWL